jgi:FkbM family methyltransferase
MNIALSSSDSFVGRVARLPLSLVPPTSIVPILRGRLRGKRWIVGSFIHRCWMGLYEYEKQKLISRTVQPNTTFYDIGANVGFYTLLSSVLVGTGKVFAFEPVPRNLSFLRKHLALNRVQNVEVLELAISDENRMARFEVEATSAMGRLSDHGAIEVQTATLDSLLEQGRILPPDYIKMDVEGAELRALKGAKRCIRDFQPQIFLATHGREMHTGCCQLLESWGYESRAFGMSANGLGEIVATPNASFVHP